MYTVGRKFFLFFVNIRFVAEKKSLFAVASLIFDIKFFYNVDFDPSENFS